MTFNKLDERIRFGALGNLYGMGIYFVIILIVNLIKILQSPYHFKIVEAGAFISSVLFVEVMSFKYALLVILLLSITFTMKSKRKTNIKLLLLSIATNSVFATILFPGALITLEILAIILGLIINLILFYPLALTGNF